MSSADYNAGINEYASCNRLIRYICFPAPILRFSLYSDPKCELLFSTRGHQCGGLGIVCAMRG